MQLLSWIFIQIIQGFLWAFGAVLFAFLIGFLSFLYRLYEHYKKGKQIMYINDQMALEITWDQIKKYKLAIRFLKFLKSYFIIFIKRINDYLKIP